MKFNSIKIRNLGAIADLSVDFDAYPETAKLFAVCGQNGSGKSTLLELLSGGAMYRECRTRGSLAHLATSRDSMLEVKLTNGQPWTLRHTVDCVSSKGESIALDASGSPATITGKVKEFDAWAVDHMPKPDLLYGSQVLAQKSSGFVDLKPGDRKAVVLRLLGVEKLEPMAKSARDRARALDGQAAVLAARILDEDGRADVDTAEGRVGDQMEHEYVKKCAAERAQQDLDAARELAGSSALARQRYEEQVKSWHELLARKDSTYCHFETSRERLDRCSIPFSRSALAEAQTRHDMALARLTESTSFAENLRIKREASERQIESRWRIEEEIHKRGVERDGLTARIANNRDVLRKADEIRAVICRREAAAAKLPELEQAEAEAKTALDTARSALEALRFETLSGANERIVILRGGLESVADHPSSAEHLATQSLREDDAIVSARESHPARVNAAAEVVNAASLAHGKANIARAECSKSATERHPHEERLATAEARIAELQPQLDAATAEVRRLSAELDALPVPAPVPTDPDLATLRRAAEDAAKRVREAGEELARVEATRAQLEPQVERLRVTLAELEAQLESTPEPTPPEQPPNLTTLEQALSAAQRAHQEASAAVGKAQAAVEAAQAAQAKAAELRIELDGVRAEQADWTRLAEDLGRDGLQASLVDAACAELTAVTNDLLHSCVGTRWTVSLDTQRASADGKKQLEGFVIRVLDTETGREDEAESLSGGELVLISEAISLALTSLACARAGIEDPDLIRDESGAALDPSKARAYVAMLRRAANQMGARILLVSHNPEVSELCDARIEMGR